MIIRKWSKIRTARLSTVTWRKPVNLEMHWMSCFCPGTYLVHLKVSDKHPLPGVFVLIPNVCWVNRQGEKTQRLAGGYKHRVKYAEVPQSLEELSRKAPCPAAAWYEDWSRENWYRPLGRPRGDDSTRRILPPNSGPRRKHCGWIISSQSSQRLHPCVEPCLVIPSTHPTKKIQEAHTSSAEVTNSLGREEVGRLNTPA